MVDVLAYIDPGSGSLIIQAVIATVVAVPFFFRAQIARLARAIRGERSSTSDTDTSERTNQTPELPR
jgi:hypothetical protein